MSDRQSPRQHGSGYYRFVEFCQRIWIYALLIIGSIIFAWPFVWMITTSIKVDREMFVEQMHVWPQRPIPQVKSPYIDTRYYEDLSETPRGAFARARSALAKDGLPWPPEVDRATTIKQVARGAFQKLHPKTPKPQNPKTPIALIYHNNKIEEYCVIFIIYLTSSILSAFFLLVAFNILR